MADRIQSFEEFWPYYVGEHRDPACRLSHYIGTTGVFVLGGAAALTLNPWLVLAIPVFAYGFAWIGHFLIEKNRPATFTYPLWSLLGDFKMYAYFLQGRMNAEVIRLYGHYAPAADAPLRVS
jgi:hypothetical protein